MIEHVLEAVRPVVGDVRISVRSEADAPEGLVDAIVADRFHDRGPLGGIHAGLLASESPWALVLACDTPFVRTSDLERITAACGDDSSAVVAVSGDGRVHPLCACYHRSLLPLLELCLSSDDYSVLSFLTHIETVEVRLPDEALLNVNQRRDLPAAGLDG